MQKINIAIVGQGKEQYVISESIKRHLKELGFNAEVFDQDKRFGPYDDMALQAELHSLQQSGELQVTAQCLSSGKR